MDKHQVVAAFGAGTLRCHELQSNLAETWTELINDSAARSEIATMLNLDPRDVTSMTKPPVKFVTPEAGAGAAEIATIVVTWIATDVLLASVKDLAKEAVKAKLKLVWDKVVAPALRKRLPEPDSLGPEKRVSGGR